MMMALNIIKNVHNYGYKKKCRKKSFEELFPRHFDRHCQGWEKKVLCNEMKDKQVDVKWEREKGKRHKM